MFGEGVFLRCFSRHLFVLNYDDYLLMIYKMLRNVDLVIDTDSE